MMRPRIPVPYVLSLPLLLFLAGYFLFPVGRMMLLAVTPDHAPPWFTTDRIIQK